MKRVLQIAIIVCAAVALSLTGMFAFTRLRDQPAPFNGSYLDGDGPPQEFTLRTANGADVSLTDFRGTPVAIYFGYTHCPDVCPTTLLKLKNARSLLTSQGTDIQVIMISVDPQRDSPETVQKYVERFDPSFIGLSGSEEEIASVATRFGVFFQKQEVDSALRYFVDHTSAVVVVDSEGRHRLLLPFDLDAQEMSDDLSRID